MITKEFLGKPYTFDPEEDQILQHGIAVRYYEGESTEDKVLLTDFVFWSARFQKAVIVPRWFVYDGASVPKCLRSVVSKAGPLEYASIPHDFGYTIPAYFPEFNGLKRKDWDLILKDFCKEQGMPWRKYHYTFWAVRAGGVLPYNSKDKLLFCPDEHKQRYIDEFPSLHIPFIDGEIHLV